MHCEIIVPEHMKKFVDVVSQALTEQGISYSGGSHSRDGHTYLHLRFDVPERIPGVPAGNTSMRPN